MRTRDRISLAFGGLALLVSVLVIGSVFRWTQACVAVLIALALSLQILTRRGFARVSPLVVLLGVASVLTALQLIPLPESVLNAIEPTGNQLRTDGATISGTTPWMCASLDPAASARALCFFVTLLGTAMLGLRFAASERGRFLLLAGVAITCGITALVTGAHALVQADSLYGLYTPQHMKLPAVFGPLLNTNHLGGLMAVGAVLSAGLSFYDLQKVQTRAIWVVIALACAATTAASRSRGAVIGMGIGFFVMGLIVVSRRLAGHGDGRTRALRRDLPVAIVVGLGLALALYASAGDVSSQLEHTSLTELQRPVSKYGAWKSSLTLVSESPWTGVGRGAVESTLPRVHSSSAYLTFSHLENEYLTCIVEWGIPGAAILAVVFAWCVITAMRRWRDGPLAAAALGALCVIVFQSSVDFGIELLGIALPMTVIATTVQLVPLRPLGGAVKMDRVVLVALLVVAAIALLWNGTRDLQEDHDSMLSEPTPTLADARTLIERHPLDYFGFGMAAEIESRNGSPNAVEYLNQALARHPTHPGLHRMTARMLVGLKRYSQAAMEYSIAMPMLEPRALLSEIVTLIPDASSDVAAIPIDYPNVDVMLRALRDLNREDIAERWLVRVSQRPQHDLRTIDTLYSLARARGDLEIAEDAAQLRLRTAKTTTSKLMLAQVQFARHELEPLLAELADVSSWTGRIDEKGDAWLILCDVHTEQREWNPAIECLHRLDASGLLRSQFQITRRINEIDAQRGFEAKMQASQALQNSLDHPSVPHQ